MTTIDTPLGTVQGPLSCESQLGETPYQRRCRQLREVFADFDAEGIGLRMSESLPRNALYEQATMLATAATERDRSAGTS